MLAKERRRIKKRLAATDPTTKEYGELMAKYLEMEKAITERKSVKQMLLGIPPEAILGGVVAIAQTVMIINTEQTNVITSKAFNLIKKP